MINLHYNWNFYLSKESQHRRPKHHSFKKSTWGNSTLGFRKIKFDINENTNAFNATTSQKLSKYFYYLKSFLNMNIHAENDLILYKSKSFKKLKVSDQVVLKHLTEHLTKKMPLFQ